MLVEKLLQELHEHVSYNPETGLLYWKTTRGRAKAGNIVGSVASDGYIKVQFMGSMYLAHRLAWLMTYGRWPDNEIDHINRDKADNRIANLRDVTAVENMANRALLSSNTSGVSGVIWHNSAGKWQVLVGRNNKRFYLGHYSDKDEAARVAEEFRGGFDANF